MGPGRFFFPANPDLADILGDMDSDFENFHFLYVLDYTFLDFQVPRFPKSGLGRACHIARFPGSQISDAGRQAKTRTLSLH